MRSRRFAETGLSVVAVLLALSVITSPASAQTAGLVAAYGFAEGAGPTVADSSGNSNTGTIGGATWTSAGKFGSGLVFNGSTAVVTVPRSPSLQLTTAMTLEAWVFPTTTPTGWRAIVDKNVDGYYLMASSDPNNRPAVGGTWTTGNQNTTGPAALPVNTWTHLAATFDGATVRLYVNGSQVASRVQTAPLAPTTGTLQIGGDAYPGENFAGIIDEVRVYNRALSAAEIQADMVAPVGGGVTPNTPPTISSVANQTINEDTPTAPLAFTVGDAETAVTSLVVTATSSNATLVPATNLLLGGSGANRTLTVTPAPNQNGAATITLTVSDGQLTATTSFSLTVTAVNDAPIVSSLANQTTTMGTPVGPLAFTVGDLETAAASLTVSGSSSNPTLVPNANLAFGGSGANRTLTVTPAPAQTGVATITIAVTDGQATSSTSFQLTVLAGNTPPTISSVANQTINEDTSTVPLAFTVGDAETAVTSLIVTATSSNATLVPNTNLALGGSGANRTLTVTPAANQNGAATITLTVSDGQLTATTSFSLTVTAVNDAPTVSSLANQSTSVGVPVGPLAFAVGDLETAAASLTVSGSSSNPTLVPSANLAFGGSGANRTLTVTPAAGQTGTATITVTVSDGQATATTTFQLTVAATPVGLVAAYGFAEGAGPTVADSSGNNNTGTISGATWTAAGKFGSALAFNGSTAVVTVPNAASLRLTTAMTLEAWVFPTTIPSGWRAIVDKNVDGYYLMASSTPNNRPSVGGTWTAGNQNTPGPTALPVNTWTHLAATFDGTTVRLYVNGAQVASKAQTTPLAPTTGTLQIGGDSYSGENFGGRIDEVRVYNRALSPAEILSDMNTPVGGTPPPPDTTSPNVVVTAPAPGSTVFNLVTVAADASDNVGIAGVKFFVDAQPLGTEVTASPYSITWDTTAVAPGSHLVTAVARDFSGNSTTSASVSVTVAATTPATVGQWSPLLAWPMVAVHAHLMPTGEVLASDGQSAGKNARLWNPVTNTFTSVNTPNTNIFCAGHCHLADGRILVAGGHASAHSGLRDTNIFDTTTRQWTSAGRMRTARWYPTVTALPDGRVLVTAGETGCAGCDAPIPEVYSPQTNRWTELTSANLPLPYYPHMFVLPDGRVLAASTSEHPIMSQVLDVAAQTWSVVDPDPVDGGSAAMYLPGKILKAGRSYHPDDPVAPSVATTYVIDMTQPAPRWQQTPPMAFARTYHTLTVLPDGDVLVTGGGTTTDAVGVATAVLPAEIWSPETQTWTTVASMSAPRLYHSTALLMPDARVLVLGGGRFNGVNEPTDQLSAQYYSPPYLFNGPRPTITSAPTTITYGGAFTVQTPDAARIAGVSFIRLGSATHAINMDQRLVPLEFTVGSGNLSVLAPANGNLAPPGYYMLFILDTSGIPSVAAIMKIS